MHHLRLGFRREDEAPDEEFYAEPRLVTHIDEAAIAAVTQLYREHLPVDGAVLDLMSSWVSHLPADAAYSRVVGLGMHRAELAANPRLNSFVVHDLNRSPRLPFATAEFDAAAICVSIQYLVRPVAVLRDLGRVLSRGGPLVISFSNRCFPTKAVRAWLQGDDLGHAALVARYLKAAHTWTDIEHLDRSPPAGDPLHAVVARRAP